MLGIFIVYMICGMNKPLSLVDLYCDSSTSVRYGACMMIHEFLCNDLTPLDFVVDL